MLVVPEAKPFPSKSLLFLSALTSDFVPPLNCHLSTKNLEIAKVYGLYFSMQQWYGTERKDVLSLFQCYHTPVSDCAQLWKKLVRLKQVGPLRPKNSRHRAKVSGPKQIGMHYSPRFEMNANFAVKNKNAFYGRSLRKPTS